MTSAALTQRRRITVRSVKWLRVSAVAMSGALGLAGTLTGATELDRGAKGAGAAGRPREGCVIRRVAACGGFLEGPVIDSEGNLWALDVMGGRILRVGSNGNCEERGRPGQFPTGAKLAPDGTISVAASSGLYSFDPTTGKTTKVRFMYDGEELSGLNDLSYDAAGGLYVTVPGQSNAINPNGRVFYRSVTGQVQLVADGLAFPNGIAVAPDQETVLVAEFAAKRILSLPAVLGKQQLRTVYVIGHTEGGIGPDGLVFDAKGRLLVANFGAGSLTVFEGRDNRRSVISLGERVGMLITNLEVNDSEAVVTEAEKGEIWRIRIPDKE